MTEKVVITGGAGFIGSNLAKLLLENDYAVTIVDNLSAGTRENVPRGAEFFEMDILSPGLDALFQGASHLFHLAARNCLSDCADHPVETTRTNVVGTANVLEACRKAGIPHFIYADTSAEYEGVLDFPSRVEVVSPLSVYACTKRAGALLVGALSAPHGLQATTVRYFNAYGPAQDWRRVIPPVMSAFTMKLLNNESPIIYGSGKKKRDFIHVDDINSFHLKLLREPAIRGKTYNLGTGQDYSVREVFECIRKEVGSSLEPEYRPDLPAEAERTLADIGATLATGWAPKITLEEGIRTFTKYMRERLFTSPSRISS